LEQVTNYGWSALSRVNGTFACVMYNFGLNLYTFRNEISPLFIDDDMNISSTKFDNSRPIDPNIVWRMDLKQHKMYPEAYFETLENPYFFT
jgi:hypothetical protein